MQIKWTHSTDNNARACERKAFYTARYANPRAADGSPRREAFLLKQAIDISLWRGNLVHKTIEKCILPFLARGESPDFHRAREWMLDLVDINLDFSRRGNYRHVSKTNAGDAYCVLRADLCGAGISDCEVEEVKSSSIVALNNLEHKFSDLLSRAQLGKELKSEKEIRFSLDGRILVEAILDLIFFEPPDKVVIVDWKAGFNPNANAREQLFVYAFAFLKCGWWAALDCKNIELVEANLMTGDSYRYEVIEDDLADVDDRIFAGSQLLERVFEKPAKESSPEDYSPAESPGTCQWCVVKEMCNGNLLRKNVQPALSLEFVQA